MNTTKVLITHFELRTRYNMLTMEKFCSFRKIKKNLRLKLVNERKFLMKWVCEGFPFALKNARCTGTFKSLQYAQMRCSFEENVKSVQTA